jgi:competence protein ComEA
MPALDPAAPPELPDPLGALDPAARRAPPRVRLAVGAAVVLFIGAVAVAAVISFTSGGGGAQGLVSADAGVEADPGAAVVGDDPASVGGPAPVLVHVLGAVARPGLVELASGARVVDAVAAAGGFAADADPAGVNLARPVVDGEQLVVAAIGQVPAPVPNGSTGTGPGTGGGSAGATSPDGTVHLNTADVAALDTLPRIGPALAQRIIDWREANGPFTSVDQLLEVAGIGDAVFSGLADRVTL